eukprot:6492092-Amphidinium_carterae.2
MYPGQKTRKLTGLCGCVTMQYLGLETFVCSVAAMNRMGLRQRLKASEAAQGLHGKLCRVLRHLIQEWSWGRLPATAVQRISSLAVADGCAHPDLVRPIHREFKLDM